ncbi:MAG TPA: MBL fold metallo-hydrolase [Candidatus Kapabacteria bacterium]|nr:MBL fold metallo-hydrolase [Candidatus Kapabacteria bacterium]
MNKKQAILFFLLVLTLNCSLFWYVHLDGKEAVKGVKIFEQNESPVQGMTVVILDIGQGDATFIEFADGTQMLIDCGKDASILAALGRVMPFYDNTLDYLVPTHPDLDHYGGCMDVLKRFDVEHVVYTGYQKDDGKNAYYQAFMQAIKDEGAVYHHIKARETWTIASTTVDFLYPDHDVSVDPTIPDGKPDPSNEESNNTSLVMKLSYGDSDLLLTGDIAFAVEEYLLNTYGSILDVELLKVGHHGSAGSSKQEFLDVVTPLHATISSGKGNSYGHPTPRTLKRLERVSSTIWRTDELGDITFHVRTSSISHIP